MNWFRELLAKFEQLFGTKSPKKRDADAKSPKAVSRIPPRVPSAPHKVPEEKSASTIKKLSTSETKSESIIKPEQDEPMTSVYVSKKTCAHTTEKTFTAEQENLAPNPDLVPVTKLKNDVALQSSFNETTTDTVPDISPELCSQPVLQPVDVQKNSQKQPATVHQLLSDEIVLCAPDASEWKKDENGFTLWQKTETAVENSLSSQVMHFRLIRKEPLAISCEAEEAVWAQDAAQATNLILTPFQYRTGITKTFVVEGIVTTIWEEQQDTEGTTRFVAIVLTHQMAYMLTGQKEKEFSVEKMSKCFTLRPEHRKASSLGMDNL